MILCNGGMFIHIPKCAGTSIRAALFTAAPCQMVCHVNDPKKDLRKRPNTYNPHLAPGRAVSTFGMDALESFYTFTFVRNPWERFVSWYNCKLPNNEYRPSFNSFLRQLICNEGNSQYRFFRQPDLYDFVGTVERLEEGWDVVCQELSLPSTQLKKLSASAQADYIDYYDNDLIEMVHEYESYIIDRFNYQFGE